MTKVEGSPLSNLGYEINVCEIETVLSIQHFKIIDILSSRSVFYD